MIDINRGLLTVIYVVVFSLLGTLLAKELPLYFYTIPIIFGFAIPMANWSFLGTMKMLKLILSCLISTAMFHVGILLMVASFDGPLMYVLSGLFGILLLIFYSKMLSNLKPAILTYPFIFILCILAIYFGFDLLEVREQGKNSIYIFALWTSLFAMGLSTGFEKIDSNPM